ncbi:MAG TPA: cytochrome c oxidase assembly protein [Steroidobacteraceae bacterium]|jgi:cytochrome c oxidase assembly protein subunit 11
MSAQRPDGDRATAQRHANRVLLAKLGVIALGMFAFGYALVPFYEKICEVTGLRNIDRPDAVANSQVDASRVVRVEFDSNVRNVPWRFQPLEPVMSVHPGAVTQAEFQVVNTTDRAITGQAIPSYGPQYAAQYFRKLECFCFSQQTLQPGETRLMPVVFVIDPRAPADLSTITLSYTFFEVEGRGKAGPVAGAPTSRGG